MVGNQCGEGDGDCLMIHGGGDEVLVAPEATWLCS
jgi:hypothetical protein